MGTNYYLIGSTHRDAEPLRADHPVMRQLVRELVVEAFTTPRLSEIAPLPAALEGQIDAMLAGATMLHIGKHSDGFSFIMHECDGLDTWDAWCVALYDPKAYIVNQHGEHLGPDDLEALVTRCAHAYEPGCRPDPSGLPISWRRGRFS